MGSEKRRHDRYFIELPVELSAGKARSDATSVDVSFGGLFIRTAHPPPARQLVQVKLQIPPKGKDIQLMAMAVFVESEPKQNGLTGVGLKLFGLDAELQERWESFVKHVRTIPTTQQVPSGQAEEAPTDEEEKPWARLLPELRIRTRTLDDLQKILHRELKKGRMYVRTGVRLESGSGVELHIVHPASQRTFVLVGQIDQRVERPGFEGFRIILPPMTKPKMEAFASFVGNGGTAVSIDVDANELGGDDLDAAV